MKKIKKSNKHNKEEEEEEDEENELGHMLQFNANFQEIKNELIELKKEIKNLKKAKTESQIQIGEVCLTSTNSGIKSLKKISIEMLKEPSIKKYLDIVSIKKLRSEIPSYID